MKEVVRVVPLKRFDSSSTEVPSESRSGMYQTAGEEIVGLKDAEISSLESNTGRLILAQDRCFWGDFNFFPQREGCISVLKQAGNIVEKDQ